MRRTHLKTAALLGLMKRLDYKGRAINPGLPRNPRKVENPTAEGQWALEQAEAKRARRRRQKRLAALARMVGA